MQATGASASATAGEAVQFLAEFGRAAHAYGATGTRIEGTLTRICGFLGYEGVFRSGSREITLAVQGTGEQSQAIRIVPLPPPAMDLDKLADIYALADRVLAGETGIARAREQIVVLAGKPSPWGALAALAAFPLVGVGVAALLSGGWWDTALAAPLSLLVGSVVALSTRRGGRALDWLPASSAFLAAVVGTLLKLGAPEVNVVLLTLSAVALLLPGYEISLGVGEVVSGRVAPGLTNLFNGSVYMIKQVAGGWAGVGLVAAAFDVPSEPATVMDSWWLVLFLPMLVMGLLIALRTSLRDLGPALLGTGMAYLAYRVGSMAWNLHVGAFLGAALVMAYGTAWETRTRRPSTIVTLPAIVFMVSGSIGFRGLAALTEGDLSRGNAQILQVGTVALSITAGIIVAQGLAPRRTGL